MSETSIDPPLLRRRRLKIHTPIRMPGKKSVQSRNAITRRIIQRAAASGELPLEYMLRVMRDSHASTERRDEMARAAAPYVHPRISPLEVMRNLSDAELDAIISGAAGKANVSISITGASAQTAISITDSAGTRDQPPAIEVQARRRAFLPSDQRGAPISRLAEEESV